eukprot:scaffold297797_cov15-Tisochrysis_lutea.AAC.1
MLRHCTSVSFSTAPTFRITSAPNLPPGTCARREPAPEDTVILVGCCWSAASVRVCRCMQDACWCCPRERPRG